MQNLILILMLIVFFAVVGSEDVDTAQIKNSEQNKIILVKERRSNDGSQKCQIFKEWSVNGLRVGCCTDNRSNPLTLCIDEYGLEIGEND